MNNVAVRRAAGTLLVIVPLGFMVCFTLLQMLFEYPDILRQPTADVLRKFAAGGTPLIAVWYVLTLSAVAFVPLTVLMHRVLAEREAPTLLWVATAFGVIAGVAQTLGFLRWPFLVPHLAQSYLAAGAMGSRSASHRAAVQDVGCPRASRWCAGTRQIPRTRAGCARVRATSTVASTRLTTTAGRNSCLRSSAASWPGRRRPGEAGGHGAPGHVRAAWRRADDRSYAVTRSRITQHHSSHADRELFAAHRAGQVRATSVRASDLFGPHVTESLVGDRFFGPFLAGKKVQLFANPDVPDSVSFVGDVGRAMVTVGARDEALGRPWHAPNAPAIVLRAFVELVKEETGLAPPARAPRARGHAARSDC